MGYYEKYIKFLKEHNLYDEEVYRYFYERCYRCLYLEEEKMNSVGVYYFVEHGLLLNIYSMMPCVNNEIAILDNIRGYIYVLQDYKKINKNEYFTLGKDRSVLPLFYSKLFIRENPTEKLVEYEKKYDEYLRSSGKEEDLIALDVSERLLNKYENQSFKSMNRKAKRLVLRDSFKNLFDK